MPKMCLHTSNSLGQGIKNVIVLDGQTHRQMWLKHYHVTWKVTITSQSIGQRNMVRSHYSGTVQHMLLIFGEAVLSYECEKRSMHLEIVFESNQCRCSSNIWLTADKCVIQSATERTGSDERLKTGRSSCGWSAWPATGRLQGPTDVSLCRDLQWPPDRWSVNSDDTLSNTD